MMMVLFDALLNARTTNGAAIFFRCKVKSASVCATLLTFGVESSITRELIPPTVTTTPRSVPFTLRFVSLTAGSVPLAPRAVPLTSRLVPLTSRLVPLTSRLVPLASRLVPLAPRLVPLASQGRTARLVCGVRPRLLDFTFPIAGSGNIERSCSHIFTQVRGVRPSISRFEIPDRKVRRNRRSRLRTFLRCGVRVGLRRILHTFNHQVVARISLK